MSPFDPRAPLDPDALSAAQAYCKSLPAIPIWRRIGGVFFDHIYLHWSVEPWGCLDGNYNAEVDLEGGKWVIKTTHAPLDNAVPVQSGEPYAAHTFARNSHAFGIAITGMVGATPSNFGNEAVQLHEIEFLCAAAAAVAKRYSIDASGIADSGAYPGSFNIMTHAEAAITDHYFPGDGDSDSRWDLARLVASPAELTKSEALGTAQALRDRVHAYKVALG